MVLTNSYDFHGVTVAVRTTSEILSEAIDGRFRLFPRAPCERTDLVMEFAEDPADADPLPRPAGPSRPLWEVPGFEFSYYPDADQLYLRRTDVVSLVCEPAAGRARCSIRGPVGDRVSLVSHVLFSVPLVEMLKRRGKFAVHAATVAVGDSGILFAGNSGSGKTTLALCLLRSGMNFLGDDTVFLRRGGDGLRVIAFPDEIDVPDSSARLFPELGELLRTKRPPGWPKHRVWPERFYDVKVLWDCAPKALVFPTVTAGAESRIESLGANEALTELLPNVPLTDVASSQAHLDALAELVRVCRCYRLWAGHDIAALPSLVRSLVSG